MEHGQADADGLPRVVVVGYGPVGRSLCRIARAHGMLPVVVEANIDTVRRLRGLGRPAVHGDATQAEVLREAGLEQAQALLPSTRICASSSTRPSPARPTACAAWAWTAPSAASARWP